MVVLSAQREKKGANVRARFDKAVELKSSSSSWCRSSNSNGGGSRRDTAKKTLLMALVMGVAWRELALAEV